MSEEQTPQPRRLDPAIPVATQQIGTAMRRISEMLLGNRTEPALMAIAWAVAGFIVDVAKDDKGAENVTMWFDQMLQDAVRGQMAARAAQAPK
jgi:hypothetical protein